MQLSNSPKRNAVVIVAAGRGSRMASDGPKQYMDLCGQSILRRTITRFLEHPSIDLVQVVIHEEDGPLYEAAVGAHSKLLSPVFGGATRQQSALAGLEALEAHDPGKVLIHDGARPFVSGEVIDAVLDGVGAGVCALPAIAIADTIKKGSAGELPMVEETIPRENLYLAQTPQGFDFRDILPAHRRARAQGIDSFTDDIAIGEWAGMNALLVAGSPQNRKITTRRDLELAEHMVSTEQNRLLPDIRTGNGYDIHRLVPAGQDEGVVLCGIKLPFDRKLDGHSDADVGLHALTDALLGTIASGDIGSHFPPSDPKWRGASSDRFLRHACSLVAENSGHITHLDVTIICEAPKIGPHRDAMREKIAEICMIDVSRVSVKATTNEHIGAVGREEGIAALATASVVVRPE